MPSKRKSQLQLKPNFDDWRSDQETLEIDFLFEFLGFFIFDFFFYIFRDLEISSLFLEPLTVRR